MTVDSYVLEELQNFLNFHKIHAEKLFETGKGKAEYLGLYEAYASIQHALRCIELEHIIIALTTHGIDRTTLFHILTYLPYTPIEIYRVLDRLLLSRAISYDNNSYTSIKGEAEKDNDSAPPILTALTTFIQEQATIEHTTHIQTHSSYHRGRYHAFKTTTLFLTSAEHRYGKQRKPI